MEKPVYEFTIGKLRKLEPNLKKALFLTRNGFKFGNKQVLQVNYKGQLKAGDLFVRVIDPENNQPFVIDWKDWYIETSNLKKKLSEVSVSDFEPGGNYGTI